MFYEVGSVFLGGIEVRVEVNASITLALRGSAGRKE